MGVVCMLVCLFVCTLSKSRLLFILNYLHHRIEELVVTGIRQKPRCIVHCDYFCFLLINKCPDFF